MFGSPVILFLPNIPIIVLFLLGRTPILVNITLKSAHPRTQGQARPNKPVNEGVYSRDGATDTGEVARELIGFPMMQVLEILHIWVKYDDKVFV